MIMPETNSLPSPLPRWITLWGPRGLPRTLLEVVGLRLLGQQIATTELRAVTRALNRTIRRQANNPNLNFEQTQKTTGPKNLKASLKTLRELEELGEKQSQQVQQARKRHPFLKLTLLKHWEMKAGLQDAIEQIVGYKPDPRRAKKVQAETEAWVNFLSPLDPLEHQQLKEFCNGSRKNIGLLVNAIVGIPRRRKGLMNLVRESFEDGSSERVRLVHSQAWLKGDGGELPRSPGTTKSADIAAGLKRSTKAKNESLTPKYGEKRRGSDQKKMMLEQRNQIDHEEEKAKWRSLKARGRKTKIRPN